MAEGIGTVIRGTVRGVDRDEALVEVEQGGCGRCHEEGGCGGQQLTQMFCAGPRRYRVANDVGAAVGERVTIAIAPGSIRRSANLAYLLPLTAGIAGGGIGMALGGEGASILGFLAGLAAAFIHIRRRGAAGAGISRARPHIVSRSS